MRFLLKKEEPIAGTSKMPSKLPDTVSKSAPSLDGSAFSDLQILYYIITLADTGMDNVRKAIAIFSSSFLGYSLLSTTFCYRMLSFIA